MFKLALMVVGDASWQGGIQYTKNILAALNSIPEAGRLDIHLFKHSEQNLGSLQDFQNLKITERNTENVFPKWTLPNKIQWYYLRKIYHRINPRIENFMIKEGYDFVFPSTLSSCRGKLNSASWIADFQYKHFPQGSSESVRADADRVISEIANNSKKIVLSSQFCESDSHKFFPQTKGKTHVLRFAASLPSNIWDYSAFDELITRYDIPSKYFIISNLFAPTKNHKVVFEAMGILKSRGINIQLVCTGNLVDYRNQDFANEVLSWIAKERIRNQVHLLGLIPRMDQMNLMRKSIAVVQPSVNEGWNTSVEEAKAMGKVLLLSDIEVHKEQAFNFGLFFNATDAQALASELGSIWKNADTMVFPDRDAEIKARKENLENLRAFGERFLDIARA